MLHRYAHQFGRKLVQRRPLEPQEKSESHRAPLNTLDLVILGVGKILRAAIYILIGKTVKYTTGPAIVICFLVATLFSLLSGFCYAELWARVPHFSSAYLNCYVTMGQLYAFITGWNLILSLVLGTAILARAWSYIFDSLIGNHISQALQGIFSLHVPHFLAKYPDFLALALVLLFMASLTLILPYYQIQPDNPLSQTFLHGGWISARYVLSVGIICAVTYSAMFPMSQVIYAMAEDGLLFRELAQVRAHTGAPIMAIMSSGNLAGVMALLFELSDLVDFLSAVTLLAYTLVAFSILVLRYQSHLKEKTEEEIEMEPEAEGSPLDSVPEAGTSNILRILLLTILSVILALWPSQVFSGDPVLTTGAVLLLLLITGVTAIIWRQPQNPSPLYFKVPALPVLPLVSTFVNLYSMMRMTTVTWALFGIWMVIGFAIYFGYRIRHSLEENNEPQPPASAPQT
ncbi:cationic amino acid transporter 3 [Bubalus bubalis]|uniref:cationic amino acid transporter 3 n=1 Tax=Bubalus bubalis TaxID=89462 RepID=UPI001E1B6685|nr:cationic amino acid transporter 3 [Bubalus bubalis]